MSENKATATKAKSKGLGDSVHMPETDTKAWIPSDKTQEEIVRMSAQIDQMRQQLTLYLQGVADQMGAVPQGATYDLAKGEFTMPDKASAPTA